MQWRAPWILNSFHRRKAPKRAPGEIKIKTDNVSHLFNKLWIGRKLEGLGCDEAAARMRSRMRCTVETDRPDAFAIEACSNAWRETALFQASSSLHRRSCRPLILRGAPQQRLMIETMQALRGKPLAPCQNESSGRRRFWSRDSAIVQTICRQKHNRGTAHRIRIRAMLTAAHSQSQLATLPLAEETIVTAAGPVIAEPPNHVRCREGIMIRGKCLEILETGH